MSDRSVAAADLDGDRREREAAERSAVDAAPGLAARLRALAPGSVASVAAREYRICARTRRISGVAVLFAAFSAVVASVGTPGDPAATVATLIELSVYLVPLAGLAFGYDAVVGARERGTLDTLLVLPIDRRLAFVGVALGRAVAVATGLIVGLAAGGVVLALTAGPAALPTYVPYALLSVAVGVVALTAGVVVSAAATEKARALGAALLLWVWLVVVHDLLAVGLLTAVAVPGEVVTALLLANPADLYRVAALGALPTASAEGTTLAAAGLSPGLAALALAGWTVLLVALGAVLFARRAP